MGSVAYILGDPPPTMPEAGPPPRPSRKQSGWLCPGCGHSYAPWVPECHHCPEPVHDLQTLELDSRP